jgi:hypothetical protein
MKKILLTLMTLAMAVHAQESRSDSLTSKEFFGGVRLGMTIEQCATLYGSPMSHSGAQEGEKFVDFRHNATNTMQWRILVFARESDGKIDDLTYWKLGEPSAFSARGETLSHRHQ